MSRILTTYKKPSIAERIASAKDVEHLARIRRLILWDLAHSKISPDEKTLRRWSDELWRRVLHFILHARTGAELTFVWNSVLNWQRPDEMTAAFLLAQYLEAVREMPSPTAQLLAAGVSIEGVSA
jgi:hypothetical protein